MDFLPELLRGFNPYHYGYFFGGRDRRRGGLLAALVLAGHWQNLPAWAQRRMHATLGLVCAMILLFMLPHGTLLVPDLHRVCLQPIAVTRVSLPGPRGLAGREEPGGSPPELVQPYPPPALLSSLPLLLPETLLGRGARI